jgi:hypothetical protein
MERVSVSHFLLFSLAACACLIFCFSAASSAQELPKEIRGYKVHRAKISVNAGVGRPADGKGLEASVTVGEPVLVDVSLTGIAFDVPAEIDGAQMNGKVDFLMFRDMRINGVAVDIEEYRESFSFRKDQKIILPKPARVVLGSRQLLNAAWKEFDKTKPEWNVTGRVFVFGKFKKFGFEFKRVVPVDIDMKIKNPLLADRTDG